MNIEDRNKPLFMISVASDLAEMHPQTLRMYERRGLVKPRRSSKHTRLYSMEDVERLRYIQLLTNECGLNLAGVERVLHLEAQVEELRIEMERLRKMMEETAARALEELEEVHRSYRKELVPFGSTRALIRVQRRSGR